MKTFNISKRVSKQARQMCEHIIDTHDKYSKSYFWYPSPTAYNRRRSEEKFKEENPDVSFTKNGDEICVSFEYNETCQHVYYHLHVSLYKNGKFIKDGNIKDIKKIIHV
jgi:hypothetical protein